MPFSAARQPPTSLIKIAHSNWYFSKPQKISAAGADCWLETQISTATDMTANLTWTLYFPFGSRLLANQHTSIPSYRDNSKDNTEVTKQDKEHVTGQIKFSYFIYHKPTFFLN